MPRRFVFAIAAFCLFASTVPLHAQTAGMLSFQGLIKDNGGQPINGSVTLQFRILDDQFAGNLVDMDGDGVVENVIGQDAKQVAATAVNGVVSAPFGPVFARSFDGNARYLEVTVNGSPLSRQFMATAPATADVVKRPGTAQDAILVNSNGNVGIGGPSTGVARRLELAGPAPLRMAMRRSDNPQAAGGIEFLGSVGDAPAWSVGTNMSYGPGFEINSGLTNTNALYITQGGGVVIQGTVGAGIEPNNQGMNLRVYGPMRADVVHASIVQILGGADLAEPFEVGNSPDRCDVIEPGMVVVIDPDHPGRLALANDPYDRKVAGIISGANGLSPGMVMKSEGTEHADGEHNVALTGRVYCWCDASYGSIEPGDRLTTSSTLGHAMKAIDQDRAGGAVIGKAMTPLAEGRGLVLVLVQPQ